MTYKNIFFVAVVSLMLTSCGLYDKYEQKNETPIDVFGASVNTSERSLAQLTWREFFTDPVLQDLIEVLGTGLPFS